MSYPPDPNNPNNPYGQPPQAPGYGYPQQAPPAGYGYPPPAPGYGGPGYGYPPAVPQNMPGLVVTTRVLLFIIGAVQIIGGGIYLIAAAAAKEVTNRAQEIDGSDPFNGFGNAAAGVLVVVGIVCALFAAFSITLGVKFGKGGPRSASPPWCTARSARCSACWGWPARSPTTPTRSASSSR